MFIIWCFQSVTYRNGSAPDDMVVPEQRFGHQNATGLSGEYAEVMEEELAKNGHVHMRGMGGMLAAVEVNRTLSAGFTPVFEEYNFQSRKDYGLSLGHVQMVSRLKKKTLIPDDS